jgi:flavin-dependent dehydrogenase
MFGAGRRVFADREVLAVRATLDNHGVWRRATARLAGSCRPLGEHDLTAVTRPVNASALVAAIRARPEARTHPNTVLEAIHRKRRDDMIDLNHGYDVIVVGGRCAGAAAAMLLAGQGHDVLVVDRADFPSDTVSTHAIARSGVVQLKRWGLLDEVLASGAPAIRDVIVHVDGERIERTIESHAGVDLLVAPRRYVLDRILTDAAINAGAELRTGVRVRGVSRADDGRITGIIGQQGSRLLELRARIVVGADGLRSRIARAVGALTLDARPALGATHYAYYTGLAWSAVELYLGDRAFSGIFPTHDGAACIWVCMPTDDAETLRRSGITLDESFNEMLVRAAPDLASRLRPAHRISGVRGALRLPNHVRQSAGPGWALVGDAGYHRDPITGHGISDAFRDAELLAAAVDRALRCEVTEAAALAGYQATRDRMLADIFDITCALSEFPPRERFLELQRDLGRAVDTEAADLAERPDLVVRARAA